MGWAGGEEGQSGMEGVVVAALVEVLHSTSTLPPHPPPPHPGPRVPYIWKKGARCRALPAPRHGEEEFFLEVFAL